MKENAKTLVFAVVVSVVVLVAYGDSLLGLLRLPSADSTDVRGQRIFDLDPLVVKSLEIVTYDEATATPHQLKVAVSNRGWSIPSRYDYPADAKDQVVEAANGLMDLKVMEVASDSVADHAAYGLVDPSAKELSGGATGVGTHVTMKDAGGTTLLDLIVGKQVPGRTELRYVRRVGQDQAYTTAAKIDRLSTKFEDWIEKNLLRFNKFDLKQIELADYQVDIDLGTISPRGEITAANNDPNEPKWLIAGNKIPDPKDRNSIAFVEKKLADDQEANAEVLDKLTTALDDLKIVDVRPKPKGLTADLKTSEDFMKDPASRASLGACGFAVAPMDGKRQIFSNQGEVRVVMKTGVEYVMRFGGIAEGTGGGSTAKEQAKDKPKEGKKDEKKEEKKDAGGSNRYLFITAEFRPDVLPKPELEKLPELPKEEKKDEPKKDAPKKDEPKKAEEKKGAEKKDAEKKDAAATKKDEPKKDEKKEEPKKEEKKPEEIKADRERIEKENKRKQEEFDKKVEDGKKEVKDLNERFADWYYVISDDVFRKIRVNREDLIRKKEKKEEKADAEGKSKDDDDHAGHDHGKPAGEKPKPNTPADFGKLKEAAPGKK